MVEGEDEQADDRLEHDGDAVEQQQGADLLHGQDVEEAIDQLGAVLAVQGVGLADAAVAVAFGEAPSLGLGEQMVLKVEAWPGADLCTWRLDLDAVVGAVPQTISLPGGNQSFRTTPPQPSYQTAYQIGPGDQIRVAPSGQ